MPHTDGRYQQALGFNDGVVFIDPQEFFATGGASTLTRNAAGDLSHNAGAGVSPIYSVNLADILMQRLGFTDADLQVQNPSANPVDAYPQGYPPFAGALTNITPRTALRVKGVKLLSVAAVYLITGADLTAHTIRIDKTVFANNVANAITPILAAGANGLAVAQQANPYVTEIAIPGAQQVYRVSDLSQYWVEIAPTTQGGGAYRMYGIRVKFEFNFN